MIEESADASFLTQLPKSRTGYRRDNTQTSGIGMFLAIAVRRLCTFTVLTIRWYLSRAVSSPVSHRNPFVTCSITAAYPIHVRLVQNGIHAAHKISKDKAALQLCPALLSSTTATRNNVQRVASVIIRQFFNESMTTHPTTCQGLFSGLLTTTGIK